MEETRKFKFKPYEINSEFDGEPHAFTRAIWDGEECEFALALVDGYVRFCNIEKLESGEWNFAISEKIQVVSDEVATEPAFLESVFHAALEEGKIGRLLCFGPSSFLEYRKRVMQWVFIGAGNKGFFQGEIHRSSCELSKSPLVRSPFYASTSLSITKSPVLDWWDETEKWLEDAESDFSFSYRWNQLYDFEKSKLVTVFKNDNLDEMQEIAYLILSLEEESFKDRDADMRAVVARFKLGALKVSTTLESIGAYSGWGEHTIYQKQVAYGLWDVFLQYFEPRLNLEIFERYTALDLNEEHFWLLPIKTDDAVLTAHERLELRLKLTDWLQGKILDDQIDSLLV